VSSQKRYRSNSLGRKSVTPYLSLNSNLGGRQNSEIVFILMTRNQ
jgi:hypothetical protein